MANAWTYDPQRMNDTTPGYYPGATVGQRYQIRFLIQDTQAARPLLLDAEVDFLQTTEANAYMAAAACCESLVTRAGAIKMKRAADLQVEYDVGFYRGLAVTLRS